MISNIEILYGLANRCRKYGIKNSKSYSESNPLSRFLEICDGVDGAEVYGWDPSDLLILKNKKSCSNFTKIDILKFDCSNIKSLIEKHKSKYNTTYFKGIYIHNKIDEQVIDKYKLIYKDFKRMFNIKIGFSIYDQKEIDLILTNNLKFDILQVPYNLNVQIDYDQLKKLDCDIYLRSIFLQGVYFSDLQGKFTSKIIKKINLQKNYLLNKAKNYNFNLGQYLFSNGLSFCKKNKFKGLVIGSSSFQRFKSYILNHKFIKTNEFELTNRFDMIDDYLADPRLWKI